MKIKLITLPLWQYLNQHIFDRQSVWDAKRFWHIYRIQLLKKCWQQQCSQASNPPH